MADTGAIRAGKASVEISADEKGLSAGIARAQKRLADLGNTLQTVGTRAFAFGAGIIGSLALAGKAFAANGEALAQRAGLLGQDGSDLYAQANILARAFDRLSIATARLAGPLASTLLPFLETLTDVIGSAAAATSTWIKQNQGLATAIVAGAGVLAAFGAGLVVVGGALKLIGAGFIPLLAVAKVAIGALTASFAALLSPIGLVAAAGIAVGAALLLGTDQGRRSLDKMKADAMAAGSFIKGTFGAIGNAIAGNDWALAFQITCLSLKLGWLDFKNYVLDSIPGLKAAIKSVDSPPMRFLQNGLANWGILAYGLATGQTSEQMAESMNYLKKDDAGRDLVEARERENRAKERARMAAELEALKARAAEARDAANERRAKDAGGISFGARGTFDSRIAPGLVAGGRNANPMAVVESHGVRLIALAELNNAALIAIEKTLENLQGLTFE